MADSRYVKDVVHEYIGQENNAMELYEFGSAMGIFTREARLKLHVKGYTENGPL